MYQSYRAGRGSGWLGAEVRPMGARRRRVCGRCDGRGRGRSVRIEKFLPLRLGQQLHQLPRSDCGAARSLVRPKRLLSRRTWVSTVDAGVDSEAWAGTTFAVFRATPGSSKAGRPCAAAPAPPCARQQPRGGHDVLALVRKKPVECTYGIHLCAVAAAAGLRIGEAHRTGPG